MSNEEHEHGRKTEDDDDSEEGGTIPLGLIVAAMVSRLGKTITPEENADVLQALREAIERAPLGQPGELKAVIILGFGSDGRFSVGASDNVVPFVAAMAEAAGFPIPAKSMKPNDPPLEVDVVADTAPPPATKPEAGLDSKSIPRVDDYDGSGVPGYRPRG